VKSIYTYNNNNNKYNNNNNNNNNIIIIIIIIQLIYLRANLTARRPITKRAREEERNKNTHIQQNTTQGNFDHDK
jgi:hypothetical protein